MPVFTHSSTAPQPEPTSAPPRRRPRPIYRVFVSSTWLDLQPERRAVMDTLNRMEEMRFVGMEFFGNRPEDTHDASLDQVDQCEVFVGLIGHRYGSGITAAEYRRAQARGLPCFVYFKRAEPGVPPVTDDDPALAARLEEFKAELLGRHTVKEFASPAELAASVTADLHNWVAAQWISLEEPPPAASRSPQPPADASRTNVLRLLERIQQDWIAGVLEASLHHRAWIELGLDWREDAVEHPWERIVVAANRPIETLRAQDTITSVYASAHNTLLILGEPGAGKTTTALELTRDLIRRARDSATEPVPVVLALSTWRSVKTEFASWIVTELGLRYQVPKRVAQGWLDDARLALVLDGLDEVPDGIRAACVGAINAFEQEYHPPGLVVTCRVAEYDALPDKLRLRSAICLQPLAPAQVERYLTAAGSRLAPLREAMAKDAGLRELARSPLMLSVMTIALSDATAASLETTLPAEATPEQRRRQVFEAYVQAALRRHGKSTTAFRPEQTRQWLTWLARRMKENGYSLFALEQLQPAWLEGTGRQLGYFLASRVLGMLSLALPLFFLPNAGRSLIPTVVGVAGALGLYFGTWDFAIAHRGWGGRWPAAWRFGGQLVALGGLATGWMLSQEFGNAASGGAFGASMLVFVMAGLAFCAPQDVRSLDIKPTGSIQWSWRMALNRGLLALSISVVAVSVMRWYSIWNRQPVSGRSETHYSLLGGNYYVGGLLAGALLVGGWWWWRRFRWTLRHAVQAGSFIVLAAQLAALVPRGSDWEYGGVLFELEMAGLFGVFGGFSSVLIDPARPQHAGVWFWLKVPVVGMLVVMLAATVPFVVLAAMNWSAVSTENLAGNLRGMLAVTGGCGLVAFFRFGGFNGVQHFLLRTLLIRGGHLPRRTEAFLSHAAQLALLQKVGLGYRFVHALLLDHLAGGAATEPGKELASPVAAEKSRPRFLDLAGRIAALTALAVGGSIMLVLVASAYGLWRLQLGAGLFYSESILQGGLILAVCLAALPVMLSARWWWRASWRVLVGANLVTGGVLLWLASDDAEVRAFPSLEVARPVTEQDRQAHALFRQYWAGEPAARQLRLGALTLMSPSTSGPWLEFVSRRRDSIEREWESLAPVRDWVEKINALDRIPDQADPTVARPYLEAGSFHGLVRRACAIATLRAQEGNGDAALATLVPLLRFAGRLERDAQRLSHANLGRTLQGLIIDEVRVVLQLTRASADRRREVTAALGVGGGSEGIRRLYAQIYQEISATSTTPSRTFSSRRKYFGDYTGPAWLDTLGPFAFNRRAMLNACGTFLVDLQELSSRRDSAAIHARSVRYQTESSRPCFKNIAGSWVVWVNLTRLGLEPKSSLAESYWTLEYRRQRALEMLANP